MEVTHGESRTVFAQFIVPLMVSRMQDAYIVANALLILVRLGELRVQRWTSCCFHWIPLKHDYRARSVSGLLAGLGASTPGLVPLQSGLPQLVMGWLFLDCAVKHNNPYKHE